MTFREYWQNYGCRVECATHEERARQAWTVAMQSVIAGEFALLREEYLEWVAKTFPGETVAEQIEHLREEIIELCEKPNQPDEYADCMMLLLLIGHQHGIDVLKEFSGKLAINKARSWKRTERGFRHVA